MRFVANLVIGIGVVVISHDRGLWLLDAAGVFAVAWGLLGRDLWSATP
jgi:hypothetical protein